MDNKPPVELKTKAVLMKAHLEMDRQYYAETAIGVYPLLEMVVEILKDGGSWQSMGSANGQYNGFDTIVMNLFVVIPKESKAIRFIEGNIKIGQGEKA